MKKIFLLIMFFQTQNVKAQFEDCGMDKESQLLAKLIIQNTNQKRTKLTCNKKLAKAALEKAKIMAKKNKVRHDLNNITPNEFIKEFGIELPSKYAYLGNQVESIF